MVKKKVKSGKKLRKRERSWTEEDVQVHTGLPPKVEGQLRCYLKLTVAQILWAIPNSPDVTHVRVKWWGEESEGSYFRPFDVKRVESKQTSCITARYAIRSGPKQFAAYLADMGSLALEVLSGSMRVAVGRAQVDQIGLLAPSRPIRGFFPVFSADAEKIAELQLSVVLESIMALYDSTSSVPTPDMSFEMPLLSKQTHVSERLPFSQPHPIYSSTDDPSRSPVPHRQNVSGAQHEPSWGVRDSFQSQGTVNTSTSHPFSSSTDGRDKRGSSNTPQPPSTSYTPQRSSPSPPPHHMPGSQSMESTLKGISTLESQLDAHGLLPGLSDRSSEGAHAQISANSHATGGSHSTDLVSVLLERGNKLRNDMIVSTVDGVTANPTSVGTNAHMNGLISPLRPREPDGDFDMKMLLAGDQSDPEADIDGRTVDLVLGADTNDFNRLQTFTGALDSSVSGDDLQSDLGDPLHDESLLQDLFYKYEQSDPSELDISIGESMPVLRHALSTASLSSLDEPGNRRPPSRQSSASSISPDRSRRSGQRDKFIHKENSDSQMKENSFKKAVKKVGKRKKESSRNRHMSCSEGSDTDGVSKLSDVSLISGCQTFSDNEINTTIASSHTSIPVDGLSLERLTLLGRVHVARVTIDSLVLPHESTPTKPKGKNRMRGKPPRPSPKPQKNCTYFVEYNFPVSTASKNKFHVDSKASEMMRVASKKVTDGVVSFSHRSVFPVLFDGECIENWWKSALLFKIYSRTPGQKVPKLMGMSTVPLKSALKSDALYLTKVLDVKDRSKAGDIGSTSSRKSLIDDWPVVGNLKICLELASDHKDFSTALARTRLAEMTNPKIVPIPKPTAVHPISQSPLTSTANSQSLQRATQGLTLGTQTEPQRTKVDDMPFLSAPDPRPSYDTQTDAYSGSEFTKQTQQQFVTTAGAIDTFETLTLHTLLMVPSGENIGMLGNTLLKHGDHTPSTLPATVTGLHSRDISTRNLYLVCRMFWCDDVVNSNVCWGNTSPQFNFNQVAPVLLSGSLLERMKNNYMIIEVWDKKTSAQSDQLVGLVKLPLHQFYMSYRDKKIAGSLLRSQYPVVAMDADVPVYNPLKSSTFGLIKVLLAMGSLEQISAVQRMKQSPGTALSIPERPSNYLERQDVYDDERKILSFNTSDVIVEHIFELSIESIKGLRLLDNMIWGEADCFVQYHFPAQTQTHPKGGAAILHSTPTLKTFRTSTTLCVPDPVFSDVSRHKLVMPEGTPIQREILTACSGAGGGAGGVLFEIWCRYYYPNVRDQVIAKGLLPLAKLCAMVTMQKQGEATVQTFSLNLMSLDVNKEEPASDEDDENVTKPFKMPQTGLLQLTVNYRTHATRVDTQVERQGLKENLPGATVCISVSILRASGLKAAAQALSLHEQALKYASEVGVNTYIRIRLSFLTKQDERVTRTVARSFAPDFSMHVDFPCPLLWTDPETDALSLAEILETSEAILELWHQAPGSSTEADRELGYTGSGEVRARHLVSLGGDVLIGTAKIPLQGLLSHKTGVHGWFPVQLPNIGWKTALSEDEDDNETHGKKGLERTVGGVELEIKFAHHENLERVIQAGRGVGWAPDYDIEDWENADNVSTYLQKVTVSLDLACFPLQNAMIVGQTLLDPAARCYVRYKFYDRDAVCSRLCSLVDDESTSFINVELQHNKTVVIPSSAPFNWYLKEERLEIQVWVTHNDESNSEKKRPRHRDKLIGSAFIDLASLADHRRRQHRISGVYPLFKPGASSLGGACIRSHVSLQPHTGEYIDSSEDDDESGYHAAHKSKVFSSARDSKKHSKQKNKQSPKSEHEFTVDLENTVPVHISIERAFHLPYISDKRDSIEPSSYVSYQTPDSENLTFTNVFPACRNPVWSHENETRLEKSMLTDEKNLVLKVWHKPQELGQNPDVGADRVLGFVSVDLTPLTTSFSQLSGWYNIMDFHGQCQGQIKVSITPQESLWNLKKSLKSPKKAVSGGQLPSNLGWLRQPPSATNTDLPHFEQHLACVKKHHEQLQQHMVQSGVTEPTLASRSMLFSNLRNNMDELDVITSKLKHRLVQPPQPECTAPSVQQVTTDNDGSVQTGYNADTQHRAEHTYTDSVHTAQQRASVTDRLNKNDMYSATGGSTFSHTSQLTKLSDGYKFEAEKIGGSLSSSARSTLPDEKPAENVSMFSQTLKNAQNLLQTINQHADVLTDAVQSLSARSEASDKIASDLTEQVSNTAAALSQRNHPVPRSTNDSDFMSTFDSQLGTLELPTGETIDDETFQQMWQNYNQEHADSDGNGEDGEGEEDDTTIIQPKPLNNVSSANFANMLNNDYSYTKDTSREYTAINALRPTFTEKVDTSASELGNANDSFFGIHSASPLLLSRARPDVSYESAHGGNISRLTDEQPSLRELTDSAKRKLAYESHDDAEREVGVPVSDEGCSSDGQGEKARQNSNNLHCDFSDNSGSDQGDNQEMTDNSQHDDSPHSTGLVDNLSNYSPDIMNENPASKPRVSRMSPSGTATNTASFSKRTRQAAEYRRKYQQHRHGNSSSDNDSEFDTDTSRPHRKQKSGPHKALHSPEPEEVLQKEGEASNPSGVVASGDDELCEDGDVMDSHNLTFDVCQAEELDDRSQNKNTRTSENQPEPIMADHVDTLSSTMPNFFLPHHDLKQTMQALRISNMPRSVESGYGDEKGTKKTRETLKKVTGDQCGKTSSRAPPSSLESNRIAKIFAQRFT